MTKLTVAQAIPANEPINLDRRVPARGGFSARLLRIELRRVLRNKRTIIFTVLLPIAFYVAFGATQSGTFAGTSIDIKAYEMITFAVYGAFTAAAAIGAGVAVERAQGWSRQLRLTPLSGSAYIAVKLVCAMAAAALPVVIVFGIGAATGAKLSGAEWPAAFVLAWLCGSCLASLGLFVGYLMPSENAMQVLGPGISLLAFAGGLFIPLQAMNHTMQTIASFTPLWGLSQIARYPLLGGSLHWTWLISALVWIGFFFAGAVWCFRRDTQRV